MSFNKHQNYQNPKNQTTVICNLLTGKVAMLGQHIIISISRLQHFNMLL